MNHFTIRDIENLSGIKAHTLRIWEQRYNLMVPRRKESSHRIYDNDDLKDILRISYLYHSGVKISKIAQLTNEQRNTYLQKLGGENANAYYVSQLMEAAIDFDEERFETLLDKVLSAENLEKGVLEVLYPFLNKIGLLWITEHVIPAQEHFASNLITRKLVAAIDGLPPTVPAGKPATLLFTPQREYHEIPILYLQYLMKKHGKKVVYFGDDVHIDHLKAYCSAWPVERLHFHLITNFVDTELNAYVEKLCNQFPGQRIVMSGPCTTAVAYSHANLLLLKSMEQLLQYVKE